MSEMNFPKITTKEKWEEELADLVKEEKELTRLSDKIAAKRRRLPMHEISKDYIFESIDGDKTLLDLFDGRRQLIVYHFMFGSDWEQGCPGCSWVVDAMSHDAHLNAQGVTLAIVGRAPLNKLLAYKERMGWKYNWFSSGESDFNLDFRATVKNKDGYGENHGVSVFFRIGDRIFQSYHSEARGVEHLGSHWTYLDLTPYGRQESWEDSPQGWPQNQTYTTNKRHDCYKSDGREF